MEDDSIEAAVATILESIGEDLSREGLQDTPRRVARMYRELFSGLDMDPIQVLSTGFEEEQVDGLIILRDLPFFSMCEHHLLPFYGKAHVGYIPHGRIVGASKIARALDILAHRPQMQERLTNQLADAIAAALEPHGVAVVLEAEHLCMIMRGVKKPGSAIVTTAARGVLKDSPDRRMEFLALVQGR